MENKIKVVLGSDHGGYDYKLKLIDELKNDGYEVIDVGTFSKDSCNYAYFAIEAAKKISNKEADFGILVCNSGEGVCIAANKVNGVRCGIGYNDEVAQLMRQHNNANMISFGAHFMSYDEVLKRVNLFLKTPFEGGRHEVRVNTIIDFEK